MNHISIIGLGYVGLPLSLQFARSGVRVTGVDIDSAKCDKLNGGESFISHISCGQIREQVDAGRFLATTDFSAVSETEAAILCVPTPLNKYREPDLSYVLETARALAPHLREGMLVTLESTTYPGTTENELRGALESGSRLKAGESFHLAYSPEREDPGNKDHAVKTIPKIVGGLTPACRDKAVELYSKALDSIHPVSSCSVAEAAKLTENIFRSVNIALVNELKTIYYKMGIDIWEVIEAADSKPFGYMAFYPGPGLGGHCIPIDPFYLTWKAREFGQHTRFIELAGEVNKAMPHYVVNRVAEALNQSGKPVKGSRILILGLAYKANVDDMRESPSFDLMDELKGRGADVSYYDPHIPVVPHTREHTVWEGVRSIPWSEEAISGFDCVVISTWHAAFNLKDLANWAPMIIDSRNAMASIETAPGQVWKA